jgi:hypothetical protein
MVMTYKEKAQASKKVIAAIKALGHQEVLQFVYGTEMDYVANKLVPRVFDLKAYHYRYTDSIDYSIHENKIFSRCMNVDKITPISLKLYAYDMFGTRTTYTLPLYEMEMGLVTINADAPITEEV